MRLAAGRSLRWLFDLAVLLLGATTVLFFLLRLTGDPALVLAGGDASPEQLAAIRAEYGFDRSLFVQYLSYLSRILVMDFGESLGDGTPALAKVLDAIPASLLLAGLAMAVTIAISIPTGLWLGGARSALSKIVRGLLFVLQGFPGFVTALLLIHVFAIELNWLPALGFGGLDHWVLPTVAVASFLAPNLIRVVEANTTAALGSGYIRTARAIGATDREILWRHAMPNALLGAVAVTGAQFAFLVTGLVIIETIFAWPGIGWLLVQSTSNLDFPVVQAITFFVVLSVFLINTATDALQRLIDPKLRTGGSGAP
jgi:peptide/nickel transport system permease protein